MALDGPRCEVCGADLTGLLSLEDHGVLPVQRVTCYSPDECAERLAIVRIAWRTLAIHGCAKRRNWKKIEAALKDLERMGER